MAVVAPVKNKLDERVEYQYQCSIFGWSPRFLQTLHTSRWLLVVLSSISLIQGCVTNGLIPAALPTLEMRYNLASSQTGLISSMYDISVTVALVPVCYFAQKQHKGRIVGFGVILMTIGILLTTVPQWFSGVYRPASQTVNTSVLCQNDNQTACDHALVGDNQSGLSNWIYMFLFAQMLIGLGATPIHTLGVAYLDENVSQAASPAYLSIFNACGVLGPAIGFIIGGVSLKIWGDSGKAPIPSTINAQTWYGAWWLGFVISFVCAGLLALPMLMFGRQLPETARLRQKDIDMSNKRGIKPKKELDLAHPLQFLKACGRLLGNWSFTLVLIVKCLQAFIVNATITFFPRILILVAGFDKSTASVAGGLTLVGAGIVASLTAGVVMRRYKLRCRELMILTGCLFVVTACVQLIYFAHCKQAPLADSLNSDLSCSSSDCACSSSLYQAVCDENTTTLYRSPCHAMCTGSVDNTTYSCGCSGELTLTDMSKSPASSCHNECPTWLVTIGVVCAVFVISMAVPTLQQVLLRVVPFGQREVALTVGWLMARLFGTVPGPILFGYLIDDTCLLWATDDCTDDRLNCLHYDVHAFSMTTMGLCIVIHALSAAILFVNAKIYQSDDDPCDNKENMQM